MGYVEALSLLEKAATKPVFPAALKNLKAGREIRLNVEQRAEFALFFADGQAQVVERPANNPDVEFILSSEALRLLAAHPGDNMAQFGISVIEQMLAGQVKVRVLTGLLSIINGGYLKIVTAAGPDFLTFLAQHGLSNLSKISAFIRSLSKH